MKFVFFFVFILREEILVYKSVLVRKIIKQFKFLCHFERKLCSTTHVVQRSFIECFNECLIEYEEHKHKNNFKWKFKKYDFFFLHFSTTASLEGKTIKFGKFERIWKWGAPWNLPQIFPQSFTTRGRKIYRSQFYWIYTYKVRKNVKKVSI